MVVNIHDAPTFNSSRALVFAQSWHAQLQCPLTSPRPCAAALSPFISFVLPFRTCDSFIPYHCMIAARSLRRLSFRALLVAHYYDSEQACSVLDYLRGLLHSLGKGIPYLFSSSPLIESGGYELLSSTDVSSPLPTTCRRQYKFVGISPSKSATQFSFTSTLLQSDLTSPPHSHVNPTLVSLLSFVCHLSLTSH